MRTCRCADKPCKVSEGSALFAYVAVDIAPASIFAAYEAAQFVQPVGAAAHLVSCDEFDRRHDRSLGFSERFDLQSEPTRRVGRGRVDVEIRGAGVRRPGRAQIIRCAKQHTRCNASASVRARVARFHRRRYSGHSIARSAALWRRCADRARRRRRDSRTVVALTTMAYSSDFQARPRAIRIFWMSLVPS